MTTYDDSPTTRRLRDLDAADRELSPAQRGRAAVTLEQVLATDPGAAAPTASPARPPRRRLLLVAGGVVAAVTAAIVVVPTFTGGPAAFASWSPVPVALVGAERAAALEACVVLQSGEAGRPPPRRLAVRLADATPRAGRRRRRPGREPAGPRRRVGPAHRERAGGDQPHGLRGADLRPGRRRPRLLRDGVPDPAVPGPPLPEAPPRRGAPSDSSARAGATTSEGHP